jgi:signal transduction histidine kinase
VIEFNIDPAARETFLDRKILGHILENLLSNAVKYSFDGQPVTLDVKLIAAATRGDGGTETPPTAHLQLKVSDSGIGIPKADLCKLFQTFKRASNVGNRPGTGMGLVIVKRCVDFHRGTIRVESEEGKGTSVWVCLPVASPDGAGIAPPPAGSEWADIRAVMDRGIEPRDLATS